MNGFRPKAPGIKAKKKRVWIFFLGLVDTSRNKLASTAYFAIISSKILGGLLSEAFDRLPDVHHSAYK